MKSINKILLLNIFLLINPCIHTSQISITEQILKTAKNDLDELIKKSHFTDTSQPNLVEELKNELEAINQIMNDIDPNFNSSEGHGLIESLCTQEEKEAVKKIVKKIYPTNLVKSKELEFIQAKKKGEIGRIFATDLDQQFNHLKGIERNAILTSFSEIARIAHNAITSKVRFNENELRNNLHEEFIASLSNLKKEHLKEIAQLQQQQYEFNQQKTFKLLSQDLIAREEKSRKELEAKYLQDTNTLNQTKSADRTKVKEHAKKLCKNLQEEIAQQPSRRQSITDTAKKDFQKIVIAASKEMQELHKSKK